MEVCMIEVFKTNVKLKKDARRIVALFASKLEGYKINFDLSDCDKILRIESVNDTISIKTIERWMKNEGFSCEVLPD